MSKQTAVEWLIQNIVEDQTIKAKSMSEWGKIFDQAKAMEDEQIVKGSVCEHKQVDLVRHACKCKDCGMVMETKW